MKKGTLLAAIGVALALSFAMPSSAQAQQCRWAHWHHVWFHCCAHWNHVGFHPWVAPTIDYVTVWWEHPYYYYSPYSIVDSVLANPYYYYWHYAGVDPVLVHRVTEVGPIHYPVVVVP